MTPKTQYTKEKKVTKLGFIRIKNFYSSKDTVMKRLATDREKIFSSYTSDKGLNSGISIDYLGFNNGKNLTN